MSNASGTRAEIIHGAISALFLRGFGATLGFILSVILGRLLGAEGLGIYFLALSAASLASIIVRLGLDNAVLKFVAAEEARDDRAAANSVLTSSLRIVFWIAAPTTIIICITSPYIAKWVFSTEEMTSDLFWMSLSILSFSSQMIISQALKGIRSISHAMIVAGVLHPLIAIAIVWPAVHIFGQQGGSLTYFISTTLTALIGWRLWQKNIGSVPLAKKPIYPRQKLLKSSKSLLTMMIVNGWVIPWAPLVLLGAWSSPEESGLFAASVRAVTIISLLLTAVNAAIAPHFSALYAKKEHSKLESTAGEFAFLVTAAAVPFLALVIMKAEWLMHLFGAEFQDGAAALRILALGQVANVAAGSVGFLLIMTGNEDAARNNAILSAALLVVTGLIMIPEFGANGAAYAAVAAIVSANILNSMSAWRRLKILPLTYGVQVLVRRLKA
ncbi:oligosaccharide flippase family protein [Limimaricola cinnabarinus]|uniref:oligosaccharide flippase family protein n=1 Tax=Limimaricola cinnabarinus TaxID=1125964 RepID=UPI00249020CA|nr:oligosaccharide flippase family protein [Limimaricola cinnabarinus]